MASALPEAPAKDDPASGFSAASLATTLVGRGGHWDITARLSSILEHAEAFLEAHPFERGLWLVVAFAAGIVAWVTLPSPAHWIALLLGLSGLAILAAILLDDANFGRLRLDVIGLAAMGCGGLTTIWAKSELVGQPGIARPMVVWVQGRLVERREEPAKARARLLLRVPIEGFTGPVLVRVNLPVGKDNPAARQSAIVRLRVRLMPPAPPLLPGAYDFARTAWFNGIAATGSALSQVEVLRESDRGTTLRGLQSSLASHISTMLSGSPGNIAAALASGDRGAIAVADEEAMRDAGLTHLLSISGLHVSALVGFVYWIVARALAFVPWIALRVRVPIAGALAGALAGIAYTLLTGADCPFLHWCIAGACSSRARS